MLDPELSQLLDEVRAYEIRDMMHSANPAMYPRMRDNLARDLARFADVLQAHVEDVPNEDIKRFAHSLNGASQSVGAKALGDLFVDLERLAKAGDLATMRCRHAESLTVIERSLMALQQLDVPA